MSEVRFVYLILYFFGILDRLKIKRKRGIKGAKEREEVIEGLEALRKATEEMFSKRTKNLKRFIKNTCPSGNGEGARNRVERANIKFLLAMRKGMNENLEEVRLYTRPPLERVGQFLETLRSVWIPSSMRGRGWRN